MFSSEPWIICLSPPFHLALFVVSWFCLSFWVTGARCSNYYGTWNLGVKSWQAFYAAPYSFLSTVQMFELQRRRRRREEGKEGKEGEGEGEEDGKRKKEKEMGTPHAAFSLTLPRICSRGLTSLLLNLWIRVKFPNSQIWFQEDQPRWSNGRPRWSDGRSNWSNVRSHWSNVR